MYHEMIFSFNRLSRSNTFGVLGVLDLGASVFKCVGFKDSGFKGSGFEGVSGLLSRVETKSTNQVDEPVVELGGLTFLKL